MQQFNLKTVPDPRTYVGTGKLEEINEKYSREMDFHSVEMSHAFPPPPPPVERVKARAPRAVVKPAPFPDAIKTPTPKAPRARALVAPAAPKKK